MPSPGTIVGCWFVLACVVLCLWHLFVPRSIDFDIPEPDPAAAIGAPEDLV